MKKLFLILCVTLAVALLSYGCQKAAQTPQDTTAAPTTPQESTEPSTQESTELPGPEITEPSTQDDTQPEDPEYPTVRLHAAVMIFDGPSYDSTYVQTVGKDSLYTIVDQIQDDDGNHWGKLKSGIGWVDLTRAAAEEQNMPPVTAAFAEPDLLEAGQYHQAGEPLASTVAVVFRPYDTLRNVTVSRLELSDAGYDVADSVFHIEELTPEKPLVAYLDFPGDMSAYGVFCTDSQGVTHRYLLTESGRNGTLIMEETLE